MSYALDSLVALAQATFEVKEVEEEHMESPPEPHDILINFFQTLNTINLKNKTLNTDEWKHWKKPTIIKKFESNASNFNVNNKKKRKKKKSKKEEVVFFKDDEKKDEINCKQQEEALQEEESYVGEEINPNDFEGTLEKEVNLTPDEDTVQLFEDEDFNMDLANSDTANANTFEVTENIEEDVEFNHHQYQKQDDFFDITDTLKEIQQSEESNYQIEYPHQVEFFEEEEEEDFYDFLKVKKTKPYFPKLPSMIIHLPYTESQLIKSYDFENVILKMDTNNYFYRTLCYIVNSTKIQKKFESEKIVLLEEKNRLLKLEELEDGEELEDVGEFSIENVYCNLKNKRQDLNNFFEEDDEILKLMMLELDIDEKFTNDIRGWKNEVDEYSSINFTNNYNNQTMVFPVLPLKL
ncbi:hypothetical protein HK099_000544 [Clydaea vesicula]|uniref:Uncharacterized protein n=1 Tax=Clydaea vesicula TaxID=447962 RepID=A0AAD5TV87_9FUNG|nr:hypothetical protein HK099_000544 [Clydaea vesicula]